VRPQVKFWYLNHNGKRAQRTVLVDSLEFLVAPGFGYQPGWFLSGWDCDKKARRSFALSRVEESGEPDLELMKWRGFKLMNFGLVTEDEIAQLAKKEHDDAGTK